MMKDIVHTGLASFGMSGEVFHAPLLYADSRFYLKKILERSKNKSKDKYPSATIVRSFEELLEDDIELVVVNTPDHTHYDYTKQALLAGKHVVVEKPFTVTSQEANELIEMARNQKKLLTVFQNRRWDSDFRTVEKVVSQTLLGRFVEFESHYDRFGNDIAPNYWREDPDAGTGVLYNLGSHLIDQALVLFGKPGAVTATIRQVRTGSQVDDYFDLTLHYKELNARLKSSYLTREQGPRFILHGTEGSFVKYGIDPQEEMLIDGHLPNLPEWGSEPEAQWGLLNTQLGPLHFRGKVESLPGDYPKFYENVYEVLRNNAPLSVEPQQAAEGIRIIEAAKESHHKQKSIPLAGRW